MVETLICVAIGYALGAIPSLMDKYTNGIIKPKEAYQMSFKTEIEQKENAAEKSLETQLENLLNYRGDGRGQKPLD